MSLIKAKYRIKNSAGVYETIHLETTANQVYFENEKTLQEMLDDGEIGGVPENVMTLMQTTQPQGQYMGRVWIQLTESVPSGPSILTGSYLSGQALCGQNPESIIGMKRR